jgi:Fur family transcriptional regulator, ferric uptake regulator
MEFRRHTRQRDAILRMLRGVKTHPTAPEVYELVRREIPRVSLGTVYRNLEALAAAGLVRKIICGHSEARFDGDISGHYHVRCVDCGRVADVHGIAPEQIDLGEIGRMTGFEVLARHLEFVGVCPECGARRLSPGTKAGGPERRGQAPRAGDR